jgi:flagellar motor protein MotB
MTYKKSLQIAILCLFSLVSADGEILTWKANSGEQFETKRTVKESLITLKAIMVKPLVVTDIALYQENVAKNGSTIEYLHGIPSFAQKEILKGEQWTQDGSVDFDLQSFGYSKPLLINVKVTYTFLDMATIDDRNYWHIKAEWYPFWIPDQATSKRTGISRISGYSILDLYWDNKSGCPKRATLTEETQYRFNEKTSVLVKKETNEDFKTVTDIIREKVVEQLNEQIKTQNVQNVEVKQSDEGIVLSIENIQFAAESAVLEDTEKAKLKKIGTLLSALTDRKLSVIGHAANIAGSDQNELVTLSTARAQSVADFLVESGFKPADMIVASGLGGSKPLDTNETPEGRSKNRRVEIVIIDQEANK